MADKIRVGIVGATVTPGGSGWGANAHVPALQALSGYELKAVCTAHEETARASAEKFGAELAFHHMNEMVSHPDVDLIAVVVRVPLHKQLVMAAIDAILVVVTAIFFVFVFKTRKVNTANLILSSVFSISIVTRTTCSP